MNNHNTPRTFAGDLIDARDKASRAKRATIDTVFTNKETEHPIIRKASRLALGAISIAGITTGIHAVSEMKPGNTDPAIYQEYEVGEATDVQIEEGARIRNDPSVERQEGGNVALVAEQDLSVSVPTSFLKEDWRNGEWIGVDADTLSEEIGETIKDGDGILWVNTQKAYTSPSASETKD